MADALRLNNQGSRPAKVWQDDFPSSDDVEFIVTESSIKVVTTNRGNETEFNEIEHHPTDIHSISHNLLVVPSRKFAFCYINKVGCTEFNTLLNLLNGIKGGRVFNRSNLGHFHLKPGDISKENGWYKGIFLRDPTVRFLSAHKDKCERGKIDPNSHWCLGTAIDSKAPASHRLQNFHASVEKLAHYSGGNPHYLPMATFCGGLASDLADFDYVGHLSGSYQHVQNQVREMLKGGGIEFNPLYSHLFPSESPKHDAHVTNSASSYDAYFKDLKYKKLVQDYYSEDYHLPGISLESPSFGKKRH